jgi:hypothetical protein
MPEKNEGGVQIPADLAGLTPEQLAELETKAVAEFDRITSDEALDATGLKAAEDLVAGIEKVRGETGARAQAAAELAASRDGLRGRVHTDGGEGDEGDGTEGDGSAPAEPAPAEPALVAGARPKTDVRDVLKTGNQLNVRLSDAAARVNNSNAPRAEAVLVASADIRGFTQGSQLGGYKDLVKAFASRARTVPVTHGSPNYVPVAQLQREYKFNLDDNSTPDEAWAVLQAAANPTALVAAGGWCAPSEISYDFFNIVAEDGMIDIPTTGIRRGGMRWPTSPSFGDLAASTGLWVWNETQDIAAATGTAQSGTKTCARVPCAAYNEARLACDGICITAGNFTTDAWPEQLANFLRLVMAAHAHRVNTRVIAQMAAGSIPVTGYAVTGIGTAVPVLNSIEMQVVDYRTKYAMSDGAVLEAIFPNWIKAMIRADLAKRKGWDSPDAAFNISDAEIATWFTLRNIAVQFVQDWQVRGASQFGQTTAITAWPSSVQFMLYAAGTWVKGNGLSLDLGIVRDSTLNATNDYTAAWSEDCWLTAMIGHESRLITVPICSNGAVGADVTMPCTL